MSTGAPHRRTLWEEGRYPGPLVAGIAVAALLVVVLLDVRAFGRLDVGFDVCFVVVCVAAALAVRPRDFFYVGVLPPLALLAVVLLVAVLARGSVADTHDVVLQAVVSGLAHHAGALITGYAASLAILALRQVALRHAGRLRSGAVPRPEAPVAAEAPLVDQRSAAAPARRTS